MKWLLIALLALTALASGCGKSNNTGYECPTCEGEVAKDAPQCVHCGQVFLFNDVHPRALKTFFGQLRMNDATDIQATDKEDAAKTQLQMFELPLNNYQMHVGQFPDTETGLESLRTPPTDGNLQQKWRGPYLQKSIPADPWGNDYNYTRENDPQTNRTGYRIWSAGADMTAETEDDISVTSY
jgi:type II secretion system protein G